MFYSATGTLFKSKTRSLMFLYLTLTTVTACITLLFYDFIIINYSLVKIPFVSFPQKLYFMNF